MAKRGGEWGTNGTRRAMVNCPLAAQFEHIALCGTVDFKSC